MWRFERVLIKLPNEIKEDSSMSTQYKLVVTVPLSHADILRQALGEAGAGKQGNYSFCSFSVRGTGRFKPEQGANPAIGEVGKLEEVEEERIEFQLEEEMVDEVIKTMKAVHPYEEIGYALYPIEVR